MPRRLLAGVRRTCPSLGEGVVALVALMALAALTPLLAACGPKPPAPHATIYVSTQAEVVSAVDAASGAVRWTFPGAGMMGTTLAGDTLYATASGGVIYALDARTGKARWQFHTTPPELFPLKPYVSGDSLYVTANTYAGSQRGAAHIYAFNATTGAPRWRISLPGYISSDATFAGSLLYVSVNANDTASGAGTLYALRLSDGAVAWRTPLAVGVLSGPLTDGMLYATTADGAVQALRASDGLLQWRRQVAAKNVPLSPVASSGVTLFVGDGLGNVHALRARDGATQWTRNFPYAGTVGPGEMVYVPSLANGALFLTSVYSSTVYALSPGDGSVLWSHDTLGYNPGEAPVVARSALYVVSGPYTIQILDARNGSAIANYDFSSRHEMIGILSIAIGPPIV